MRRLACVLALVAGCGADDDDGGKPIPIEGLEAAIINVYCNLYEECGLIDDAATCRAIYPDIELDPSLLAAVQAGKVIYHPDRAAACLAGISGSCDRNLMERGDDPIACDETFEGTVAGGGQCAMDEECISRNCNVPSCPDACCQGTCVGDTPPVHPRVGEACGQIGIASCVESFCDTATSVCVAYRALGEACTSSSQCRTGSCTNSVCTPYPGPGETCSSQTQATQCSLVGYTCSATSMTCVAYGLTGDPCSSSLDCSPIYQCNPSSTCQLRPTLGEPCLASTSNSCIDRSYCEPTTSLCSPPKADDMPCMEDRECASNNCDFDLNVCTTRPICI